MEPKLQIKRFSGLTDIVDWVNSQEEPVEVVSINRDPQAQDWSLIYRVCEPEYHCRPRTWTDVDRYSRAWRATRRAKKLSTKDFPINPFLWYPPDNHPSVNEPSA